MTKLELISHKLCPYVQRAVIVAAELGVAYTRTDIELAAKPDWFTQISPTGKVPLLKVTDASGATHILFESSAICQYIDDSSQQHLLPTDPILRALARAWMEFASQTLSLIAGLYSADTEAGFEDRVAQIRGNLAQIEVQVKGPWFQGASFGLVDASFAPVFRYFDAFERLIDLNLVSENLPTVARWRADLAARTSVMQAVANDYSLALEQFLHERQSHLGRVLRG